MGAVAYAIVDTDLGETDEDAAFIREFNDLLVYTFRYIERFEEQALHAYGGIDISVNDAHFIEAVGRGCAGHPSGITVSQVATSMSVRVPTATAAVNRLVAKGMLTKQRSSDDLRTVFVRLTHDGRRAYRLHALFHRRMVDSVTRDLDPAERDALVGGMRRLKAFFGKDVYEDASFFPFGQNDPDAARPIQRIPLTVTTIDMRQAQRPWHTNEREA